MTEREIGDLILAKYPFTFRNDCGTATVGGKRLVAKTDTTLTVRKGQSVVVGGSQIRYGLQPGSADRVGWHSVVITPEMVGQRIAQFCSIEIKTENDQMSKKQKVWRDTVLEAGGIAEVWNERGGEIVKE